MRPRRVLIAVLAALVTAAVAFAVAPAASADSVWFQSVGRASATTPCPDPSFGTPWQSNWDPSEQPWRPSWSQWMNGGTGGFTCDRSITWAKPSYPSAGCLPFGVNYVNFGGGWAIGVGAIYTDANCTTVAMDNMYILSVYAPAPWDGPTLCREALEDFEGIEVRPNLLNSSDVWTCALG